MQASVDEAEEKSERATQTYQCRVVACVAQDASVVLPLRHQARAGGKASVSASFTRASPCASPTQGSGTHARDAGIGYGCVARSHSSQPLA